MFRKKLCILVFGMLSSIVSVRAQLKPGDKAPTISITSWIKNVPENKDLQGKFIVLDFWATWCAPCLETVPHMNKLVEKNKARQNLVFLAITDENKEKVDQILQRVPYTFSAAVVNDVTRRALDGFQIKEIPTCVIIDDNRRIQWIGHPSNLNNEIIEKILNRENPSSVDLNKKYSTVQLAKIADSVHRQYVTYFKDEQIKEYFNFGPLTVEKAILEFKTPNRVMVIGYNAAEELSKFLDVSRNQIILPAQLVNARISYIYKTRETRDDEKLRDLILQRLNLKFKKVDSLMEVMQLEVVDSKMLKEFTSESSFKTERTSSSESYIGISNGSFSKLRTAIENVFNMKIVLKDEKKFSKKMSMTVRKDNLDNLKASLRTYGIEVSFIKKPIKTYKFEFVIR